MDNKKRLSQTIAYDRRAYTYPMALMAPPIVLQKRVDKNSNCSTTAGTDFVQTVWNHTVKGEKCLFPYDCDADLSADSSELLACQTKKPPDKFFGAPKLDAKMGPLQGWFFEFLQTVAHAPVLKRIDQRRRAASGQDQGNTGSEVDEAGSQKQSFFDDRSLDGALVFDPHSYLDYQTRKLGVWQRAGVFARAFLFLRLLLPCCAVLYFDVCPFVYPHRPMHAHACTEIVIVAFSPDRGVATLILIDAVLTTGTVEMDYSIKNYQAIQGERLLRYRVVIACLFIMILLILIDQVLVLVSSPRWRDALFDFLIDVVLQVALPLAFFSVRLQQIEKSGLLVDHTVGAEGFAGIQWDSRTLPLQEKIQNFLDLLRLFEDEILLEQRMGLFYFVMASAQLCRMMLQTEAHPRTALLVKTVKISLDTIGHFLVVYILVFGGAVFYGHALFGWSHLEFRDLEASFRTLWDLGMLGTPIESGALPSTHWSNNPLMALFLLTYSVLMFMVMLNVVIAVILESYMAVKQEVEDDPTEQSIWADTAIVASTYLDTWWRGWPSQLALVNALDNSCKMSVDYLLIRQLFPEWRDRAGIMSWIQHYGKWDFLLVGFEGEEHVRVRNEALKRMKNVISEEISLFSGVPPPNAFERIQDAQNLELLAFKERNRRKEAQRVADRMRRIKKLQEAVVAVKITNAVRGAGATSGEQTSITQKQRASAHGPASSITRGRGGGVMRAAYSRSIITKQRASAVWSQSMKTVKSFLSLGGDDIVGRLRRQKHEKNLLGKYLPPAPAPRRVNGKGKSKTRRQANGKPGVRKVDWWKHLGSVLPKANTTHKPLLILKHRDIRAQEMYGNDSLVLTQAPAWVAEVAGGRIAQVLAAKLQEHAVDGQLLLFFDDDSWQALGVEEVALRERLRVRQQLEKARSRPARAVDAANAALPARRAQERPSAGASSPTDTTAQRATGEPAGDIEMYPLGKADGLTAPPNAPCMSVSPGAVDGLHRPHMTNDSSFTDMSALRPGEGL